MNHWWRNLLNTHKSVQPQTSFPTLEIDVCRSVLNGTEKYFYHTNWSIFFYVHTIRNEVQNDDDVLECQNRKVFQFSIIFILVNCKFPPSNLYCCFYPLTDFWMVFAKLEILNTIFAPAVCIIIVRYIIVCTHPSVYFWCRRRNDRFNVFFLFRKKCLVFATVNGWQNTIFELKIVF